MSAMVSDRCTKIPLIFRSASGRLRFENLVRRHVLAGPTDSHVRIERPVMTKRPNEARWIFQRKNGNRTGLF